MKESTKPKWIVLVKTNWVLRDFRIKDTTISEENPYQEDEDTWQMMYKIGCKPIYIPFFIRHFPSPLSLILSSSLLYSSFFLSFSLPPKP
ncbi:hypothetical protein RIF29_27827 [Crotalaria pallida]|uniref:Uncharacterized protein n=1 Tax=Crotalaria pallida TaxID=3830 RepID=A0AAN9EX64_CROPI